MLVCGIEEAGRGPVIGPMVMAAVTISEEDEEKLLDIGVKDSKLLSPAKREALYPQVLGLVSTYRIEILSPEQIDAALADEHMNLNWLEAATSVRMIDALKPDVSKMDCPTTNVNAYYSYICERIQHNSRIIAEHKADLNHSVVAAASIIAKVTRDREIKRLHEHCNHDFGSGYPGDPKTKEFLRKHYRDFAVFRKSWSSYKRLLEQEQQSGLADF